MHYPSKGLRPGAFPLLPNATCIRFRKNQCRSVSIVLSNPVMLLFMRCVRFVALEEHFETQTKLCLMAVMSFFISGSEASITILSCHLMVSSGTRRNLSSIASVRFDAIHISIDAIDVPCLKPQLVVLDNFVLSTCCRNKLYLRML